MENAWHPIVMQCRGVAAAHPRDHRAGGHGRAAATPFPGKDKITAQAGMDGPLLRPFRGNTIYDCRLQIADCRLPNMASQWAFAFLIMRHVQG
ncbi:hypothetical protein CJ255_17215 [Candidatus Viridilinea mediisalina]|uniref:Uncharacterized protein n=1 Tax=Candidatus Viridilinea mediisalina TaxID=2024553 RepID=A0A2A6RFU2_9CHLR|nr:hypothetical protein CJ255_17215 [Candidatus Viridilinea mediisalina]